MRVAAKEYATCEELAPYLDGRLTLQPLSKEERSRLYQHFVRCERCFVGHGDALGLWHSLDSAEGDGSDRPACVAPSIGFSMHDLGLPLGVRVRDEEVSVDLLGFWWAARVPGWGTAEFYRRRILRIPRKSGETVDAYFCFTPREWAFPLTFGWDGASLCLGLLCWQIEVWYQGSDP